MTANETAVSTQQEPLGRAAAEAAAPPAAVAEGDRAEQARTAFETGRAASDPADRLRWLDRAHRLLPADPTFALVLAEALLGRGNPRAETLLRPVAEGHDVREAWLALAAARLGAGDPDGAADALAHALSRHTLPARLTALADAVARAAGAAGWCALASDGAVLAGPPEVAAERRRGPDGRIRLQAGGHALLGSPLDPSILTRTEGFVEWAEPGGGLRGWAWLPSNPDRAPALVLRDGNGRERRVVPAEEAVGTSGGGLLARRRSFRLGPEDLTGFVQPLNVLGEDGGHLLGSPLSDRDDVPPAPKTGRAVSRPARVAVIVPVHGGGRTVLDCLASVRATLPDFASLTVVQDGGCHTGLARRLDRLAEAGALRLIRIPGAAGFPGAANAGMSAALPAGCDVILLNSDTLVTGPWIEDLRRAAYSGPRIGTVTPFSNRGGFLSYPYADRANAPSDLAATRRLAAAARAAAAGQAVEIPVGVGFCLYIRRDCLRETGLFRIGAFAQGYGEENDLCLRAAALGWRHVAAPGVFVSHIGGASMGGAADDLRRRNSEILERLHPGYHARIAEYLRADPLFPSRRNIDLYRWQARSDRRRATLIITHDQGGGVEQAVTAQAEALSGAGARPLLLRPARFPGGGPGVLIEEPGTEFPNLKFAIPAEMPALLDLLRNTRVSRIAVHHLLGHSPEMRELPRLLKVPHEVHVHDYAWICPRVILLEARGTYCGEPDRRGCRSCVARGGSFMDGVTDAAALRGFSAGLLGSAERVAVPSRDARDRMRRYFPDIRLELAPHDGITGPTRAPAEPVHARVAVVGAIGPAKGYDVLLALARDAAARRLPLSFVVVGHTTGDAALLATGRVFVTGPFAREEAESLIRAQNAALALIPSVVPETWCFALSDAWRAGLDAAAFDLGAQAERIRESGTGFLLPLGCAPAAINNALLAACEAFRHEGEPRKAQQDF